MEMFSFCYIHRFLTTKRSFGHTCKRNDELALIRYL